MHAQGHVLQLRTPLRLGAQCRTFALWTSALEMLEWHRLGLVRGDCWALKTTQTQASYILVLRREGG